LAKGFVTFLQDIDFAFLFHPRLAPPCIAAMLDSQRAGLSSWICQLLARQLLRVWRALQIPGSTGNPCSGQAYGIASLLHVFRRDSKEKYLAHRAKQTDQNVV
ncbi:MAG: hypothetical protein LJE75_10020, partial [Gammaproteobacteria bacterium]|nr:hypothetical protein [Gammaproteobacteria bacterium]